MRNLSFVIINDEIIKFYTHLCGEMAEWSNAPVLKTDGRESVPRVRIPVPPPLIFIKVFQNNVLCHKN